MGKTYVALGAMALFRHFQPNFRLLVIAPRENIQRKWMKELRNFAKYNVKFTDFRNRSVDEQPGRPLVACDNLVHFVHEAVVDPDRDFFARLSSFSLGLSGEDATDKSAVTPGPLAPARELLGEMLLEAGDSAGALAAFEASMVREPRRCRGTHGSRQGEPGAFRGGPRPGGR